MKNIIYIYDFRWDGFDDETSLTVCNRQFKAQSGEIDKVNVCIIFIGFRARILNEVSNLASDTSRSLSRFLSTILFLRAISEQLVASLVNNQ